MLLLFFRALLPNPNHSVFLQPKTPLMTGAKRVPEASEVGVSPKGDGAHFPGVTASTAPSTELLVAKNCQRMGQQRPCSPTKAGKRRRERKEGWKALRKLRFLQHITIWGWVCRSYKGSLQGFICIY